MPTTADAALILGLVLSAATLIEKGISAWRGQGEKAARKALAEAQPTTMAADLARRLEASESTNRVLIARVDDLENRVLETENRLRDADRAGAEAAEALDVADKRSREVDKTIAEHGVKIGNVEKWLERLSGRIPRQRPGG